MKVKKNSEKKYASNVIDYGDVTIIVSLYAR